MKWILFFNLILASFALHAASNRVGDHIIYHGNFSGQTMRMEMSYISFQDPQMIRQSRTFIKGNLASDESELIAADEIITMEKAGLMVALCSQNGGIQEYVNLSVGKTLTCKVNSSNVSTEVFDRYRSAFKMADTIWLGPFPVTGIAQMEIGGNTFSVINYHWN